MIMKRFQLPLIGLALAAAATLVSFLRPEPAPAGKQNPTFLFLSDVHVNAQSKTTAYGQDTGLELWAAFLAKVERILSGPNAPGFIVYTGDLPAHYKCNGSCYLPPSVRGTHDSDLKVILNALNRISAKYNKPIFYLPGNNDALAGDYFSFSDSMHRTPLSLVRTGATFFPNPSMGGIPGMVSDPHAALGFYSARPVKGLRLIALNTVIYNAWFEAVDGSTQKSDGNVQMSWLRAQLADAEASGEKVYLAMHVPPGTNAYDNTTMWTELNNNQNWQNTFLGLTTRYQGTIAGILYGHTHMDEVRRLYDTTGARITEVAISCPGVTPQHKNNPGFKVVQYDATSKELMDFTTYFTTPTATVWGDSSYTFSKVYSSAPGASIYDRLSSLSFSAVSNYMTYTYMVRNGLATYPTARGIEVKPQTQDRSPGE